MKVEKFKLFKKAVCAGVAFAFCVSFGAETYCPKTRYLDFMQESVGAYTDEILTDYINDVEKRGIWEHGYARLASNLGILLAHGREKEKKEVVKRLMDFCCKDMPTAMSRNGHRVGNDFGIKEIVSCIIELEKAKVFPQETIDGWKKNLSEATPDTLYSCRPSAKSPQAHNWAVFGAASEQSRVFLGINGDKDYVEKYISDQLRFFDENGMYMDPNQPAVYDLVTRLQFAVAMHFGYDGPSRPKLEETMLKSAPITLNLLSASGEIPYGGRSNQFLHNDSLYVALCEFYATWMKSRGDTEAASKFKGAAKKAADALEMRFKDKPFNHVKNFFPLESKYGCEGYAYFLKYMVTAGSWSYLAYLFADDSIKCAEPQNHAFACNTSPAFHWTFLKAGDYSAQFDLNAFTNYDASGLGRIQRKGAPATICLSVPFAKTPKYGINITNDSGFAIFPVWSHNKKKFDAETMLQSKTWTGDGKASSEVCVLRNPLPPLVWTTTLGEKGAEIELKGTGSIGLAFPVFLFDGKTETDIKVENNSVSVFYKGWVCKYETDGNISDTGRVYGNRNGHYKRFEAKASNVMKMTVTIERAD